MGHYLLKRLGGLFGVVLALIVFTFVTTNMLGDPISLMADPETARPEDIARLREAHGLDRPLPERFLHHLTGALTGDFGTSITQNRPAGMLVLERLPATLGLALATIVVSLVVAVTLAILMVRFRGSLLARVIFVASTAAACIPSFWLAILLIMYFAVTLKVLPTAGYGWGTHLILPVLALAATPIGHFTQVLASGMTEQMNQNYVQVARAKGVSERSIVATHVFRNTAVLATTMVGSTVAVLFNGSVLAENIFAWPGIGQLGLQAVQQRDLPTITAVIFYAGLMVTLINLAVDIIYAQLDPRIRIT